MTSSQHSEPRNCNCGCRAQLTGKGNYKPGHDAKHVSNLARAYRECAGNAETQVGIVKVATKVLTGPLFSKFIQQCNK